MKYMGVNEIRKEFLEFFESKGHLKMDSFPLVPVDDDSLLLINSGMAPLKKYFTGEVTPPNVRVTTSQKCIRTPDIDNVGKTARHGTFFEMLGNFSFGDYFKKEAIHWAWEFCTVNLELPKEDFYVTVYEEDDDAYNIWHDEIGISADRIIRNDKSENFWEHGAGPCGPCSEIYVDRGEKYGCDDPNCAPGCDCDRYLEIWNLVFTQFESDGKGTYTPLANPNIDTGMGLERIAFLMQGVDNLFEVDTVRSIITYVEEKAGVSYKKDENTDVSLRVIADHMRSTVFLVSDGVLPSNEGRGYVLRRLMRRASRHGRMLGIKGSFLSEVAEVVISQNESVYPELRENDKYIKKVIVAEEERFGKTIDQGMNLLQNLITEIKEEVKADLSEAKEALSKKILSGKDAFKLYDTFGFPIDLTREILEENDMTFDEKEFKNQMNEQRTRARKAREEQGDVSWTGDITLNVPETEFIGYDILSLDTKIEAIVEDREVVDSIFKDSDAAIVLTQTPFYAEGGGQIGDTGIIKGKSFTFDVYDCQKTAAGHYYHMGRVVEGMIESGADVTVQVDEKRREAITRNHSGAHILQAALRKVLGDHVHQAGSYVDENRVRFDFSHFEAITPAELYEIEQVANEYILSAQTVTANVMPIEEAKKGGALALFGEKYGDNVRVVKMGDFSTEFCGGCHVKNSSQLGLMKILSESSIAAGVRRIEATTGFGVLKHIYDEEKLINKTAKVIKVANVNELPEKVYAMQTELKEKDKEIESLNARFANVMLSSLEDDVKDVSGLKLVTKVYENENVDTLRSLSDAYKAKNDNGVIVIANIQGEGKGVIMVSAGKDAIDKGVHSGNLVKELAKLAGGSGGGRKDNAMAGIKDTKELDKVLDNAADLIANSL